jgi:hypothetical protein
MHKPKANGLGLSTTRLGDNPKYRLGRSRIQHESIRSGRRASGQSSSQQRQTQDLIKILMLIHLHSPLAFHLAFVP